MRKLIGLMLALFLVLSATAGFAKVSVQPMKPEEIQNKEAKQHFNEGVKAFKNQKFDDAVTHFQASAKADESIPETHINLGLALAELGKKDEAKKHFDEALNLITKETPPTG